MNIDRQAELRDFAGEPESSRRYFGWRVVAALFVIAVLAWGFGFYGHAAYLAELQRLHDWPTSLIAAASTVYYLSSAVLVIFVNDAIRRYGSRVCVVFGALCFAGSIAALSQVTQPWQLFAVYLVMALAWATLTVGAITNILGHWFDRRRGLAISLALNGASFGGVIVIPAMVFAISSYGFAATMLAGSIAVLAVAVPLAIFVLGKPAPIRLAANVITSAVPPREWTRASAMRSPAFWVISGPFSVALFSQAAFLVHQIAFLETSIGRASAGIAVAVMTAASICGRLAMGSFVDRLNLRVFTAISFTLQALALIAMTQTTNQLPLFFLCAVYGLSVGNVITLPSLIVQREFPAAAFGMLVALSTAITQFTYAFGPGLIGVVRDASVNYTPAILLCVILNLLAAGVILLRPKA
jgi:MFS family permease